MVWLAEYLLGIDSGTTACKSIVFDVEGHPISGASAEYGIRHPKPTWAEQDPDWWWNAAVQTVREALRKGKISEKEILYLMSRRLSRDQAISMIIRGFMDVGIFGLPKSLSEEINRIVNLVAEAS